MPKEKPPNVLLDELKTVLKQLSSEWRNDFCGLGLIVYDTLSSNLHCDLRPHLKCPSDLVLGSYELNRYLQSISVPNHPLHDGFHFIDKTGTLTHVAQYFVPAFIEGLVPNQKHGVRVHSAICGSFMEGILFTGVVCSNGVAHLFRRGQSIAIEQNFPLAQHGSSVGFFDVSTTITSNDDLELGAQSDTLNYELT